MYQTVTTRFREIKRTAHRVLRCQVCRKRLVRQRTFSQTVSPFNRHRNEDGSLGAVRTAAEVAVAVQAEADAWQPPPLCGQHWTTGPVT